MDRWLDDKKNGGWMTKRLVDVWMVERFDERVDDGIDG